MQEDFQKLLKSEKYQVFLFTCPATMPFSIGTHPWFVVNRKGTISRWEIIWRPEKWNMRWGHLYKDFYPRPEQGIEVFPLSRKYFWGNGKLLGCLEGDEGSLAHKISDTIASTPSIYPYCDSYSVTGPNSNTYVQWVLNQFPDSGLKLPCNAFGKHYKE
jgi:hypothetical protein